MAATRLAWITALAGALVVVGLAVSAAGLLPLPGSVAHSASGNRAGNGAGSGWANGTYNVTFTESGLPSGTFWSVNLHGAGGYWYGAGSYLAIARGNWGGFRWNGTTNSSLGFSVHNGTFDYSIGDARNGSTVYAASPSFGNVTVNGTGVSVAVAFAPISFFNITFSETGLPAGTFWSVSLHASHHWGSWGDCGFGYGGFAWNGSSNSSIGFSEPDGLYHFAVGPVWANGSFYTANPNFGNVTVNGSALNVSVAFTALTVYNITFSESGLPNGTNWTVGLFGWYGGFSWNRTASSSLNFTRPDGVYDFAVGPVWNSTGAYVASPEWGNVTVNGSDVTVDVEFAFSTGGGWDAAQPR